MFAEIRPVSASKAQSVILHCVNVSKRWHNAKMENITTSVSQYSHVPRSKMNAFQRFYIVSTLSGIETMQKYRTIIDSAGLVGSQVHK